MYFTKLHSFVKKRHDVVIQTEVHHAGGRKRVETYGVDLLVFADKRSHPHPQISQFY